MNEFIFHKAGQGLFYSGQLSDNYQFVFDCGTNNSKALVQNEFSKLKKAINFVVVSHLHKDHINCLQDLISKFAVKKIYLPYLRYEKGDYDSKNLVELILWNGCYDEWYDRYEREYDINESNSAIKWKVLYRKLHDIYIRGQEFWHKTKSNGNYRNANYRKGNRSIDIEFVGGDTEDTISKLEIKDSPNWFIKLYNKQISLSKYNDLKEAINKELGGFSIDEYIRKKDYKELARIYNTLFPARNLHAHSTVMLHYPLLSANKIDETFYLHYEKLKDIEWAHFDRINDYCPYLPHLSLTSPPNDVRDYGKIQIGAIANYEIYKNRPIEHQKPITLLTGDVLLDDVLKQEILSDIKKLDSYYLFCQIPHHGSYDNWNSLNGLQQLINRAIIPFGWGNRFGYHRTSLPNDTTIDELNKLKNTETILATQCSSYKYRIKT